MAENEEDTFDIDIYGDGGQDYQQDGTDDAMKAEETSGPTSPTAVTATDAAPSGQTDTSTNSAVNLGNGHGGDDVAQKIASTDESAPDPVHLPKHAPQTQGLKRKDGADDRYVDPGATTALFVSELHWWVNDDDVRGWANQAQCEDELEEITFSEHKVNGKSKGQAYVLFKSPQAATAAKQRIESFGEGQQYTKKFTVSYTNPYTNPFKTLPKDGPQRNSGTSNNNRSTTGAYGGGGTGMTGMQSQNMGYNNSGGYRGNNRGGGYNNRGGMNNMGGYNRGGFQQPMTGGFQGGFQASPMGAMQPYGGFQNRGAMAGGMRGSPMGMRGGRGGMGNGMMGMPMNGMGMPAMGGMGMNMPQMAGGMGMQGMLTSYNDSNPNPFGHPELPATPAVHYTSAEPQAQYTYVAPQGQEHYYLSPTGPSPPKTRGSIAPGMNSESSSAWAQYTQYSPPAAIPPPAYSSQAPTPGNVTSHSSSSAALNHTSLWIGTQTHFNPAFFPQQSQGQQGGASPDANWNPHGAKRTRQE